ncbi:MAG: hypothetical protein OXC31_27790, partial [Spirochaetaceae bacterium]|nr:hypothetical protein [Spirochaetaceae bacterium]
MDAYSRRIKGFALDLVAEPPAPRDPRYVAAVMPAEVAEPLLTGPTQPAWPLIAFGPDSELPRLFLAGCADYLRDPWTPEEFELRALRTIEAAEGAAQFGDGRALRLLGRTLSGPAGTGFPGAQAAEGPRTLPVHPRAPAAR